MWGEVLRLLLGVELKHIDPTLVAFMKVTLTGMDSRHRLE